MKPASFRADMLSVIEQCNRAAKASPTDRLTTDMCQKLPALIQDGKCRKEPSVPDGIVFDFMNGHESGRSRVTTGVKKALGRSDPALVCDLGDRTFAYWFTGEKRSCNNIGIVFTAAPRLATLSPQPVPGVCGSNARRYSATETAWPTGGNFCAVGDQSSPNIMFPSAGSVARWSCSGKDGGAVATCEAPRDAAPPPPPPRAEVPAPKCGMVSQRYIVPTQGHFIYVPGLSIAVCRGQVPIPDTFVNIPGDVMTVTRQVEVCR